MDAETVVAIVAAAIAAIATIFNAFQVRESRRQTDLQRQVSESAAQPYVWADVRPSETQPASLHFVLGNSGPTVATRVRVTITSPIAGTAPHWQRVQERLADGVSSLAPGRQVHWPIGVSHQLMAPSEPQPHTIRIDCEGPFGPVEPIEYTIDISDYRESSDDPFGSLHLVRKSIDALSKVIKDR